jgi:hypothetical protein
MMPITAKATTASLHAISTCSRRIVLIPPSLSHQPWITSSTLRLRSGSIGPADSGAVITRCRQPLPWPRTMSPSPTALWRAPLHPLLERLCSRPHHTSPRLLWIIDNDVRDLPPSWTGHGRHRHRQPTMARRSRASSYRRRDAAAEHEDVKPFRLSHNALLALRVVRRCHGSPISGTA